MMAATDLHRSSKVFLEASVLASVITQPPKYTVSVLDAVPSSKVLLPLAEREYNKTAVAVANPTPAGSPMNHQRSDQASFFSKRSGLFNDTINA